MTASFEGTIDGLLRHSAASFGMREALAYRDERWNFLEIDRLVTSAARTVEDLAGERDGPIAIAGVNHPAYVLAYFAAHRLGRGTVEIGRDESRDNIAWALENANAAALVTDRDDLLVAPPVPALSFAALQARSVAPDAEEAPSPQRPAAPRGTPCIVYTSGTTGTPKGVLLTPQSVLFVVQAVCDYLRLTADDRYAVVLPLAHTYGKSNLLSAFAAGAAVVFVEQPHDPEAFFGRMMRERCTVLSVVPFHLNVLARRGLPADVRLDTLRAVTTSGGPLPESAIRAVTEHFPGAELFSMYGLTESSTRVTYLPPELLNLKRGSVGMPLPGVQVEIRGDDGAVLPASAVGHVYVRGPNVMVGYIGEPDATAEALSGGWLNTGDLGYLDDDGCLYLSGREKEIIKVAGERISPLEIEEVLVTHPHIAEAAVVGRPDPLLGETVWAYVRLHPHATGTGDVASYCAARLSPHKVPRRVIVTDVIPRTPTGKIRRHLLQECMP